MIIDCSSIKSTKLASLINKVAPNGITNMSDIFGTLSSFSDAIRLNLDDFCEFLAFAYQNDSLDAHIFGPVWKLILAKYNDSWVALPSFLVALQANDGCSPSFKTFLKNIIVTQLTGDNKTFRLFIPDTAALLLYCIILFPEYSQKITTKFCEPEMQEYYLVFYHRLDWESFIVNPWLTQPLQVAPYLEQIDAFCIANPPPDKITPSNILATIPEFSPAVLLQVIMNRLKITIPEKHRKQLSAIHLCLNELYQTDSSLRIPKSRILDLLIELVELIASPDKVDQRTLSLCLPAKLLMQLLDTNPLLCVQLLKDLIITGDSKTYLQLTCDSSIITGGWSVDQIFMIALRNGSNSYFNYRPYTNWLSFYEFLTGVTHISEGLKWLEQCGFQDITYSNKSGFTSNNINYQAITFNRSLATLKSIKADLEDGRIISLSIDSQLLTRNSSTSFYKKSLFFHSVVVHIVVLKNLELNEADNTISLTMWSNARSWKRTLPIDEFLNYYHGYETAKIPKSNLIATR